MQEQTHTDMPGLPKGPRQPDAEHPAYRYLGRIDFRDAAGPRLAWAGSGLRFRFRGPRLVLHLASSGQNAIRIRIDEQIRVARLNICGSCSFTLDLDPADDQPHSCEIIKLTEPFIGTLQIQGIELPEGEWLPPPPQLPQRIEFMGDSITGGFGVTGDQFTDFRPDTCDVTQAYAWLCAEALGFEPRISAWSGLGLTRNHDDSPLTWPERYHWVLPELPECSPTRDWQADWIVIHLGTNDFANGVVPPQPSFVARYHQLLNEVRQNHPQARIICCQGPLLQPPASDTLRRYLQQVLQESSLEQVYALEFAPQLPEHGYGVTMHPSRLTHQLMAKQLSGFIAGLQAAQHR